MDFNEEDLKISLCVSEANAILSFLLIVLIVMHPKLKADVTKY